MTYHEQGLPHGTNGTAALHNVGELVGRRVAPTNVLRDEEEYDEGEVVRVDDADDGTVLVRWELARATYVENVEALDILDGEP